MAHIYLCRPQAQMRTTHPLRPNAYLDDVVRHPSPSSAFASLAAPRSSPDQLEDARYSDGIRGAQASRFVTEQCGYVGGDVSPMHDRVSDLQRSPTPHSDLRHDFAEAKLPPPPYAAYHGGGSEEPQSVQGESAALRRDLQQVIQLLQMRSSRTPTPPPATAAAGHTAAVVAAHSTPPPVSDLKRPKKTKQARRSELQGTGAPDYREAPAAQAASRATASTMSFAHQFLLEYEALSRRDLMIEYYATFPQRPVPQSTAKRGGRAAASLTSSSPALSESTYTSSSATPVPPGKKHRAARAVHQAPRHASPSRARHCRRVFPGVLWNAVLRHHRAFLVNALVNDAEAALGGAAVEVSSMHCSTGELEVIFTINTLAHTRHDAAALLDDCAFSGVWGVYTFIASVTARAGGETATAPARHRTPARGLDRELQDESSDDASAEATPQRRQKVTAAAAGQSRVGGAPWRLSRRQGGGCGAAALNTQAELVVPLVFAIPVTNKLRRAARSGASSGDLHVALRRDGLYAVPSAKEVQVRATRVNADGLYVELVFRWAEGEAVEDGAEEAMDDAPFTDTWRFLEECQPATATSVLATVTKRGGSAGPPEKQQREETQAPVPQQSSREVTEPAEAAGGDRAAPSHKSITVRSVVCEVPLSSPEWRALAKRQPDALRAALRADIERLTRMPLSPAQLSVSRPQASPSGSVSIGFELDAVPERAARRVEAASFPQSFPRLAGLSPRASAASASAAALPAPQRATAATMTGTSLASVAAEAPPALASTATEKVTQMTQTVVSRLLGSSGSTVSEGFSEEGSAATPPGPVTAATQTSFATTPASSPAASQSHVHPFHPLLPDVSGPMPVTVGEPHALPSHVMGGVSISSAAHASAAVPLRYSWAEASRQRTMSLQSAVSSKGVVPLPLRAEETVEAHPPLPPSPSTAAVAVAAERAAHTPTSNSAEPLCSDALAEEEEEEEPPAATPAIATPASAAAGEKPEEVSLPVVVERAAVRPYIQGSRISEVSLGSMQVTEAAPTVAIEVEAPTPQEGARLSFSMQGDKWGALVEEYPALLKRALQADVQALFNLPAAAMDKVEMSYEDKLRVVVHIQPGVALEPAQAVSAAFLPDGEEDGTLPVERLQHVWNLYDEQPAEKFMVPVEAPAPAMASPFASTRRPREQPEVRRQLTDSRVMLQGSLMAVQLAPVESLPSPTASEGSSQSRRNSVLTALSTFQVLLEGTMWHSILARRRGEVLEAFAADMAELLAGELPAMHVGDVEVLPEDGRLQIHFTLPRSALPCGLNPPQFRWAVDRLPLAHLRKLHDAATARVPTTLQVRRFFEAAHLTPEAFAHAESTIRTLFIAETCTLLDTEEENLLRLLLTDRVVANLLVRVPHRSDADEWQKALMRYDYPVLTQFLRDTMEGSKEAAPLPEAGVARRGTLLSSSSLLLPTDPEASTSAAVATPANSLVSVGSVGSSGSALATPANSLVEAAEATPTAADCSSSSSSSAEPATPAPSQVPDGQSSGVASKRVSVAEAAPQPERSSSAHVVLLEGPLWERLATTRTAELQEAALADAAAAVSPLSALVEQCASSVKEGGALLTFLLCSCETTDVRDVEAALQSCPFTAARALHDEEQARKDREERAAERAASVFAMQLDGEAWQQVLASNKAELTKRFVLEALSSLRGRRSGSAPIGVAVRAVQEKSNGLILSYEVLTSVASSEVDRYQIAEVVEQHAFPSLWELYDAVMLTREPYKETANPRWIAARRQRQLNTTYDASPATAVSPRSYSFIGYADQEDLETYLQHAAVAKFSAQAPERRVEPAPREASVGSTAGEVEYDFKHLPAPTMSAPVEAAKRPMELPRLVGEEVCPSSAPATGEAGADQKAAPVSLTRSDPAPASRPQLCPLSPELVTAALHPPSLPALNLAASGKGELSAASRVSSQRVSPEPAAGNSVGARASAQSPPHLRRPETEEGRAADGARHSRERKSALGDAEQREHTLPEHERVKLTPRPEVARSRSMASSFTAEKTPDVKVPQLSVKASNDATLRSVLSELRKSKPPQSSLRVRPEESDDDGASAVCGSPTSVTDDDADSLLGAHKPPHRQLPPSGAVLISGTMMIAPVRPADMAPIARPARARSTVRIPLSPPVVIPRGSPASASRPSVAPPAITSARSIDAPRRRRRAAAAAERPHPPIPAVPEVAPQSRPSKGTTHPQAAAERSAVELPRLHGSTAPYQATGPAGRREAARPAVQRSAAGTSDDTHAPGLRLPGMSRHQAGPITITSVRMGHPPQLQNHRGAPVAPAALAPPSAPAPSDGLPRTATPQLASGRSVSPRQLTPARPTETDTATPVLPHLYSSPLERAMASPSTLAPPPTNRSPGGRSVPPAATRRSPPPQVVLAAAPAAPVSSPAPSSTRYVSPFAFDRPSSRSPSRGSARAASEWTPATVPLVTPDTSARRHRVEPKSAPAPPKTRAPQLTQWDPAGSRKEHPRPARGAAAASGSFSGREMLSSGRSSSLPSRPSRSPSPASSSLRSSVATPPRNRRQTSPQRENTPEVKLPRLRGEETSYVAVTTEPNDRLRALWNDLNAVEQSMRTRYPRMERDLMMAARGAVPSPRRRR